MVFHIADDHFAETFRIFVLRTTQKNDFIAQNGSGILLDIVFRDVVRYISLKNRIRNPNPFKLKRRNPKWKTMK